MEPIHFYKYHGTGNDFVMIDNRAGLPHASEQEIKALCDRRFGIGGDGLIYLERSDEADFRMVYFNSDGRESTFCGNGGRCVVAFAKHLGVFAGNQTTFTARDGLHSAELTGGLVRLHMRDVETLSRNEYGFELFTGSPHLVMEEENIGEMDVKLEGAKIRYSPRYAAGGINVNFVQQMGDRIFVRTYERGVEDETLSCGTGVTAAALVMAHLGWPSPVSVKTPGGMLSVAFETEDPGFKEVYLTGPAVRVFEGEIWLR